MQTYKHLVFAATGGTPVCVRLPMGHRGIINSIRLKQVGGTAAAATADLYCSEHACESQEGVSEPAPPGYLGDPALYKVCPTMTVSAGGLFETYGQRYEFINTDTSAGEAGRALYLLLSPQGSGAQQWAISINYASSMTP